MVEIELDGQKVAVPEGSMVMHAAEKVGTYVPHFCYHKKLSIAASCRMCLVEVEKAPKPLPACATPVTPGMVVRTRSEKAVKAQQGVMEFLLINHPLDCPICDQGGECQLQDLAVGYGGSKSRYAEEKRVVFHKNVGPLISMEEMSRCIHCTRCVRFGQEVAGVMELGMPNRGEHAEITTFVGRSVDSELSGNMIDLCPVGALTSKPFRYSARTWELARRKSVSPHDSTGANLIVQIKNNRVMRVVPHENEAVNECWLADRDRFSYEGLNADSRLTRPMIKRDGAWQQVEWAVALDYAAKGLQGVKQQGGALATLVSPHVTVEEAALSAQLMRALGSEHIDSALRQQDDALRAGAGRAFQLGRSIASLSHLDTVFVIGSNLRKEHPLFAQRIRQTARHGAAVLSLHAVADDWAMPVHQHATCAPDRWLSFMAEVASALVLGQGIAAPVPVAQVSDEALRLAQALRQGQEKAVLLGNTAMEHPQASQLYALAAWIAAQVGATVGVLGQAANAVGVQLVGATPGAGGRSARALLGEAPAQGVLMVGVDPLLDSANPQAAHAALAQADMVVALSSHRTDSLLDLADVLLPMAPFTETSGTFVNAEGLAQSFVGVVPPLGETRPGWKVLRVLANHLGLPGFDYESSESVRASVNLNAQSAEVAALQIPSTEPAGLVRLNELPIYAADMLVREAPSLQATRDGRQASGVQISRSLALQLQLTDGDLVRVSQGQGHAVLPVQCNANLADGVVRVAGGLTQTVSLGAGFAAITVEKA
ncbi:NADH-quinone oxidoreductase subunit NuoG [Inhella gelatinilytica]|uniref:NADH-quinone oxidoreductase n=1 Tax=Inhella gelatinilytica TaxID=2795030 RepID=A0A931IZ86_9BURK|nr:NADH-quinone oxidoreductase subunit NuoG [Inhella gelatinilytica]MBH9553829.1 NADH-quinone oxidoreductase subunit G [Inhella gelatinilytica]